MEDYDYGYNSDYENNDYDNGDYIDEEGYDDNYERGYRGHHGGGRWFPSMDRDEERRIAAKGSCTTPANGSGHTELNEKITVFI